MNILGLTHPMSWNNAACLIADGRLVGFAEEERLIRVKYARGVMPLRAIEWCLGRAGLALGEVHAIAVGWDLSLARTRKERTIWEFLLADGLRRLGTRLEDERVRHVRHHLSHALSTYFASGWDKAAILTLDGSGEQESGLFARGEGDEVTPIRSVPPGSSFGYLYGKVTEALGFAAHAEEGKVMGLAAFGTPRPERFDFLETSGDLPEVNKRRLRRFLDALPRRAPGGELTDEHRDLAATLQKAFEDAVVKMARWVTAQAGSRDLCLAGGCALNCAANAAILRAGAAERIFIQPAAHDAGTALGAAMSAFRDAIGVRPEADFTHAYHGPDVEPGEVERLVRAGKVPGARKPADLAAEAAALLAAGKVLGWCRGRAEVGPRALGARSILADPRGAGMRDRLNALKGREPWRPYGPTVLAENAGEMVEGPAPDSPFMLLALPASARGKALMPAVVHADGTLRLQTLRREANPVLHDTIQRFRDLTQVPGVVNTSFNRAGEPIVGSPRDALAAFFSSGLDALVLGDWLILKESATRG